MAEGIEVHPYRRLRSRRARKGRGQNPAAAAPLGATLFYLGAGFLLGRAGVFDGLHPFGPAFYAALLAARPPVWAVGLAVAAGLATVARGPELLAALAGLAFIGLTLGRLARQGRGVPALAVAGLTGASLLAPRGVLLAFQAASLDRVLALGSEAILAAFCGAAFTVVLGNRKQPETGNPAGEEVACWLVFALGLLAGLAGIKPAGLPLLEVGAGFLVLLASLAGGAGAGTVAGVAVGLVPTLTSLQAPSWIALYAVSGLLGGLLSSFRRAGVVLGFLLGMLLLSVYFFDRATIVANLEAALAAAALFVLLPEPILQHADWLPLASGRTEDYWQRRLRRVQELIREQLRQLAAMFRDLGESFRQLHAARSGQEYQVAARWSELVPKVCAGCPAQELCFQREGQSTVQALAALLPVLREKEKVELDDLPPEVRAKCIRPRELAAGLSRAWEAYRRFALWQEQLRQTRDLVAEQLLQVAGLMGELEKRLTVQGEGNRALAADVAQALRREGVPVQEVETVVQRDGQAEVRLYLPRCENKALCRQHLRDFLGRLIGQHLVVDDSRCPWRVGGKDCQVRFLPGGTLRLGVGFAQAAKDGCAFCGDAWAATALPGGHYFLGLSDGMGSGRKAAQDSEAAMSLVTRLLTLGFSPETAVRTVNSLLLQPGEQERFATMDLVFVNLYTGEGRLVKVGAAPSFLKRGQQVWVLNGAAPPAGILRELELAVTTKFLEPGDLLLLVTDGVLVRGEEWLVQALAELEHTEPQAVAELLLHQARALAGNCLRDDMSILAVRVERAG